MDTPAILNEADALLADLQDRPLAPAPPFNIRSHRQVVFLLGICTVVLTARFSTALAEMDVLFIMICNLLNIERDQCFQNGEADSLAATYSGYELIIRGVSGVFVVPYILSLSDRFGRKPILLTCMVSCMISKLILWILLFKTEKVHHYMWLLVPAVFDVGDGISTLLIASISDLVKDANARATFIGWGDSTTYASVMLGPTLGSQIIARFGLESLYKFVICLCGVAILAYVVLIPESLNRSTLIREQGTEQATDKSSSQLEKLKVILFNNIEDKKDRHSARLFAGCAILRTALTETALVCLPIYVKRQFKWSAVETGYFITGMSGAQLVTTAALFPLYNNKVLSRIYPIFTNRVDKVNLRVVQTGLSLNVVGFAGMAQSGTALGFVLFTLVDTFSSMTNPSVKYTLLKYVDESEYGSLIGALYFANSLITLVLPPAVMGLYGKIVENMPSLPFLLASPAFLLLLGVSTFIRVR